MMAESPEFQVLLACGRLLLGTVRDADALDRLRRRLNWSNLLKSAADEGMEGLVAFQVLRLARAHGLDLPSGDSISGDPQTGDPLEALGQILRHGFVRNGTLLAELSKLREPLRQRSLQAILLKGGALIETVYQGQPGVRPLSDLDLLVKAADLPIVVELLLKQGFQSSSPSSTFFLKGRAAIDLHTDLIGAARIRRRASACRFDAEAVWQNAVPLDPHDPTLLVLSPPDQALHLVVHALKHSFSRLIWFVDLGLILQRAKWVELLDRAEASGILRPLALSLCSLRVLMGVEIPPEVMARLPRINPLERWFLHAVASRQSTGALGEVMMAFSIPGLMGKIAYLAEFGFPRPEVLAEVFPSTPSWLRYPRRGCQFVAQGFKEGRNALRLMRKMNRQTPVFEQTRSAGPR